MRKLSYKGDEEGSIVLVILVILVASGLIITMVSLSESGLRASRRSGDSANALQVADAGVNDALRKVAGLQSTATPTGCTDLAGVRTCTSGSVALPNGGTYQYVATRDPALPGWHVVSTGTDRAGLVRKIRADAVESVPQSHGLFVQSTIKLAAGSTIDSYVSGASAAAKCSGAGVLGTNDAAALSYTGTGQTNCAGSYPYDGCISYGDPPGVFNDSPPGPSLCPPPPRRFTSEPSLVPDLVVAPAGMEAEDQPSDACATPLSGVKFWTSVSLTTGCVADPSGVKIYTNGPVTLGETTGTNFFVNRPPIPCPSPSVPDIEATGYYCSGWPKTMEILVVSNSSSTIVLHNGLKFWGTLSAPTGIFDPSSGAPQVEVWGAFSLEKMVDNAQFKLHYDEALKSGNAGSFRLANWAQEPG